jgi:hypothetical protein
MGLDNQGSSVSYPCVHDNPVVGPVIKPRDNKEETRAFAFHRNKERVKRLDEEDLEDLALPK